MAGRMCSSPMIPFRSSSFTIERTGRLRKWPSNWESLTIRTAVAFPGWAADFADYNNDGWPDIFVDALASQRYALFRNSRGHSITCRNRTGVGAASILHSGWGAKYIDFDNDGRKDLFVGQGHVMDNIELTQPQMRYLEPTLLLRNAGPKFVDVSEQAGQSAGKRQGRPRCRIRRPQQRWLGGCRDELQQPARGDSRKPGSRPGTTG